MIQKQHVAVSAGDLSLFKETTKTEAKPRNDVYQVTVAVQQNSWAEWRGDLGALSNLGLPWFAFLMRSVLRGCVAFQYADAWPNH